MNSSRVSAIVVHPTSRASEANPTPCYNIRFYLASVTKKYFALPGNEFNLKAFPFTEQVVGYQRGLVENV